jgi:CheY-like chemotaxis protein
LAKRVLIVDDSPGGLALLRDILAQPHLTVIEASSGRQALDIHRREPVDLIIMDVQMAGMDGAQVTRTIRGDTAMRAVSILLFADSPRVGLRERCYTSGANDFIEKPFTSTELMSRVWPLVNVAPRKHTALLAHVIVEGDGPAIEPFVARIVNVSTSGLLLEADVPLDEGRAVLVKFFVPGSAAQVTANATITRRTRLGGAIRWGVRFATLDQTTRQILRDYVGG